MRLHNSTRPRARVALAVGVAATAAITLAMSGVANADSAARPGDVVGVGSDTIQNAADFMFDSAPGLTTGYNENGNKNRVFNEFATGDANGRATYDGTCGAVNSTTGLGTFCDSTTDQTPNLLPGSIILRDGTKPVVRPNGSGAGIAALDADGSGGYEGLPAGSIQYARMSRLPKSTEVGTSVCTSCGGGVDVYQVATDNLQIAASAVSTNAPAGLTADQLYHIFVLCDYTKWNQIPGNSSGSSDTIHPLIPQSGSGTRNFFLADLQTAEGLSSTPNPGPCTRTVEEHDPTGIYADPTPQDAIEPFSAGKIALINSGYFENGAGYSGTEGAEGAYTPNLLTSLLGTPPGGGSTYNSNRGLYIAIKNSDLTSTTPFQPGGTQNWAQTLIAGGTISDPSDTTDAPPFAAGSKAAALIAKAGFTQAWKFCGLNATTC